MNNPFELRYSLLTTAKQFLENQYKAQLQIWELADKTSKKTADLAPKFPTTAEVIDAAIEMNKFISDSATNDLVKTVKRMHSITMPF